MNASVITFAAPSSVARPAVSATLPTRPAVVDPLQSQVRSLMKWADSAEQDQRQRIENQLVALGPKVVSALLPYLASEKCGEQAMAAMVLLRVGAPALPAVQTFLQRQATSPSLAWVGHFLAHHFTLDAALLPTVAG